MLKNAIVKFSKFSQFSKFMLELYNFEIFFGRVVANLFLLQIKVTVITNINKIHYQNSAKIAKI